MAGEGVLDWFGSLLFFTTFEQRAIQEAKPTFFWWSVRKAV